MTTLKIYRQFYQVYSHLDKEVAGFLLSQSQIGQSVTDQFGGVAVSNKIAPLAVKSNLLFNKLSFTHLVAILPITDPLERAFYETMAIRGTWSVRELQRQIDSNYYFRSGWSQKPEALAKLVEGKAETDTLALDIKSPFTFVFLGLQAKDVVEESDLETALITHLQDFILELGMGFCFEERQKKMLIDDRSCVRKMRDYIIRYRSSKIR